MSIFKIRQHRAVYHRESNLYLGQVAKHPTCGGDLAGLWSAWLPSAHCDEAVGTPTRTRHEACLQLIDLECIHPPRVDRRCQACRNTIPHPPKCLQCPTDEEDLAFGRDVLYPQWWNHYHQVKRLVHKEDGP